jgi:hypothetical protein
MPTILHQQVIKIDTKRRRSFIFTLTLILSRQERGRKSKFCHRRRGNWNPLSTGGRELEWGTGRVEVWYYGVFSANMYIMDAVVYEDAPRYDIWLKAIMLLPVFFVIMGVSYLITNQVEAAIGMFALTLIMAATYWAIFPRKYLILDSRIRIVLGGPFSFNIPFDNLETAKQPERLSFGINFATCFSGKNAVEIIRKKGMNINITPNEREPFLQSLDKALNNWREYNIDRVHREMPNSKRS